jgi:gas vesicle protein
MTDRNQEPERGSGGSGFLGFLIGGIVGAIAMLFLAPQSGEKTREELRVGAQKLREQTDVVVKEKTDQVRTRAQEFTAEARKKVDDLSKQGKDLAVEGLDRVSSAAEAGKKAIKGSGNGNSE